MDNEQYKHLVEAGQCFPICRLYDNVLEKLHLLDSIDWSNITKSGLDKSITLDDFFGPIKDIACLDLSSKIHLSNAFCQYLWSVCYVASRTYDCNLFQNAIDELSPEEREQFKNELVIGRDSGLVKELSEYIDPKSLFEKCYSVYELGSSLFKRSFDKDTFSEFYKIPNALESNNAKVNAIYCYGVVFIICHELGHYELQHPVITSKEQEEAADDFSFWSLYFDVKDEEKVTVMIGILSALCSLFFLSSDLTGDVQHPLEDQRVIRELNLIKDEYPHYCGYVLQLFKLWAFHFNIEDFPDISKSENCEDALQIVLEFIDRSRGIR